MEAYKLVVVCEKKTSPPIEVSYLLTEGKIMDVYRGENTTTGVKRLLEDEKTKGWNLGKTVEILLIPLNEKETKDLVKKMIR